MSTKEELYEQLHGLLIDDLLRLLKSGEATPSDRNVIRQFLKDNRIESAPRNKGLMKLAHENEEYAGLPFGSVQSADA